MRTSLKSLPKWLFLPPAVALLMVLGPMSMQSGAAAATPTTPATTPDAAETPAPAKGERLAGGPAPAAPRTPDMLQMASALGAVLLLGAAGVMVLRKLRGGAVPARGSAPLVTLRQTLRLTARQAVHAVEFDDRILLIGEHERGLVMLDGSRAADRGDEAEILSRRTAELAAADEDGAVPKNLVIPRPPKPAAPKLPSRSEPAAMPRNPGLNDFRALLQKVGRA